MFSVRELKPNGITQSCQLGQSVSVLRVVGWYISSDQGLHCLPLSHKKNFMIHSDANGKLF